MHCLSEKFFGIIKNIDATIWRIFSVLSPHSIQAISRQQLKIKSLQKINSDALAKYKGWKRVEKACCR